jgi:hypothetical protein
LPAHLEIPNSAALIPARRAIASYATAECQRALPSLNELKLSQNNFNEKISEAQDKFLRARWERAPGSSWIYLASDNKWTGFEKETRRREYFAQGRRCAILSLRNERSANRFMNPNSTTRWYHFIAYFFGGAFLANAIPHFVNGVSGSPFQSPFASPPGQGLSSATVNVLWGSFNLILAYLLIARVGRFELRQSKHVVVLGLGALLIALFSAHIFGKFHGGNL